MNESQPKKLQPYQPTGDDPLQYPLSTDRHGKTQIGEDWIPVESRCYVGKDGQRLAYLWQHLSHRFDYKLANGQQRPYDATNINECQCSADIVKRLHNDYIDQGKAKIGSLIAGNFKDWGYNINNQSPTHIKMVTKIIKFSDKFENDFHNNPDEMLRQLYCNVNLTVDSWK